MGDTLRNIVKISRGMLNLKGKIIVKRALKGYLAVTKVWFCVKLHASP
jgi:hypothetical protein